MATARKTAAKKTSSAGGPSPRASKSATSETVDTTEFDGLNDAELAEEAERAEARRIALASAVAMRKQQARAGILESIKAQIVEHGVTAKELGFKEVKPPRAGSGSKKEGRYGIAGMVYGPKHNPAHMRGTPVTWTGAGPFPNPLLEWTKSEEGQAWAKDPNNTTWLPLLDGVTLDKDDDKNVTPAQRLAKFEEWSKASEQRKNRKANEDATPTAS